MSKVTTKCREKNSRVKSVKCKKGTQCPLSSDENTAGSDLIEKLKEISLNPKHMETPPNDRDFDRIKKVGTLNDCSQDSNLKSRKNQLVFPKPVVRRTKKKNSFIVSDSSSITDDDGVTVYHRVLTERIKIDVAKLTPRRSVKQKISHDDGIFTPYIIRRRSDTSYSDLSDEENHNFAATIEKKYSEIKNLAKPKSSYKKNNNSDSDSDSFKSAASELSPIIFVSPKNDLQKKDLSWCFSDKGTSSENEVDKENTKPCTPVVARRKKNSISSTPITFRLNNLKKLTPTPQRLSTPNDQQESWLFLRSLSNCSGSLRVHHQAEQYKKKFKKLKEQLAEKLFILFNEEIFENRLPSDTKIEWSGRMRSTSGFCYNKRLKTVIGPNNECPRLSRIVLSTKIIETPERLRDTLIHEMCHAAAWIVDNKADGHGPCWKSWVSKVHRKFPDLPPIKRCHDYSIKTKFKYRCVNCGYTIGRHSKSLNLERKRCGYCFSKFELLLHNELKSDSIGNSPKNVKARPLSKFALFVKDNYGKIKSENPGLKHGDVMKALSKNFAETKNSS